MQKKLAKPTPKQQAFIDAILQEDLPDFVMRKITYTQGKTHLFGPATKKHCDNCVSIIEKAYMEFVNGRLK